jgi:hypothetical protein
VQRKEKRRDKRSNKININKTEKEIEKTILELITGIISTKNARNYDD